MKEGGRDRAKGTGATRARVVGWSRIALSMLLLIGAGLLIKSFVLLRDVIRLRCGKCLTMRIAI